MKKPLITLLISICLISQVSISQNYTGKVLNKQTNAAVEYVNIGIPGKNIGTVCDMNGNFTIKIDTQYENDTLLFSCLGYEPSYIKVKEFMANSSKPVLLTEKTFALNEVVVKPKKTTLKTVGITSRETHVDAGFKSEENNLGYELGLLIHVKKNAEIEKININIKECTYDSVFFRLNIYNRDKKDGFVNMVKKPIYIKLSKEQAKERITVDLQNEGIMVQGDFLVSLEYVKNLGNGRLSFCSKLVTHSTYYRLTSQGDWKKAPLGLGVGISADVKIEE
jgi:carboxypeptidase-like protein